METLINNELIKSFSPCYNPASVGIPEDETLSVIDWVTKYRDVVNYKEDIIWLLCRKEFMSDRDMRLFAVWCARESFKLQESVDQRSIDACNVAERFANGETTEEELDTAESAAWSAWSAARFAESAESARSAAWSAAESAAESAAWSAWSAAWSAPRSAPRSAQLDELMNYFK